MDNYEAGFIGWDSTPIAKKEPKSLEEQNLETEKRGITEVLLKPKVKFSRIWAMPSKHTFTIKPIQELLKRYVKDGKGWIDPFAGENSPAEFTNDINPEKPTKFHMDANQFVPKYQNVNGCLFDPPYSVRQVMECYNGFGKEVTQEDTQISFYSSIKDKIALAVKPYGIVICCGWTSMGMGKNRGFELIEILLIPHGGTKNDTIVTVERKIQSNLNREIK